jgi:predicted PurR-regulated permease PerM
VTSDPARFQRTFLLLLVVAITAVFVTMIRSFLITILLAAIFSGVCHPVFAWLRVRFRGRSGAAAAVTVLLFLVVVLGPLLTLAGIVAGQALLVSQDIQPRVQEIIAQPMLLDDVLRHLPFYERLLPYRSQILAESAKVVESLGSWLFQALSGTIGGTVVLVFRFFVFLYTMFFLLKDGRGMLDRALAYVPLPPDDQRKMVDRFVSVTRATLRGTLLIGTLQGTLSGLAFWAVGVPGALFWGTVMIVLSIIPGIGGALVWVPAAVYLLATGAVGKAVFLTVFCGLVVGLVDNLLRPRLVGRDTQLGELSVFFSTLGGILMFGAMGFIIGPIVAALFVTVWEIYGQTFREHLVR